MSLGTTDDGLQALLADLRAGAIDRREFIRRAGAAGVSLAAIAALVRSAAAQATPVAGSADAATGSGGPTATAGPGGAGSVAATGAETAEGATASSEVRFFLNGRPVAVADPSPDLLLVDWLRSPQIGLAGPKIGCGQGGCGACTVIVSDRDADGQLRHRAVNSCLRPVASLGGTAVTTVEGTGSANRSTSGVISLRPVPAREDLALGSGTSAAIDRAAAVGAAEAAESEAASIETAADRPTVDLAPPPSAYPTDVLREGMNPVAYRLAVNNGSQCGYCSAGFVMNMTEFLANNPRPTKAEIEAALDGHICRCTGYRPILTAMKTFASDWSAEDEAARMACALEDGVAEAQVVGPLRIPVPAGVGGPAAGLHAGERWLSPTSLRELGAILAANRGRRVRLVHANTGFGVYPDEYVDADLHVDIRAVPELHPAPEVSATSVRIGAGATYADLLAVLDEAMAAAGERDDSRLGACRYMARRTAGRILRNAATVGGNAMLVLRHIASGTGDAFPSDLYTAIAGIGGIVEYATFDRDATGTPRRAEDSAIGLAEAVAAGRIDPDALAILAVRLPRGNAGDIAVAQKVALREVNAHSIVNATTLLELSPDGTVDAASVVFGGIAPYPWRATETERFLAGRMLAAADAPEAAAVLAGEVAEAQRTWASRAAENVHEGVTAQFQADLATGFLYKALIHALDARGLAPSTAASGGEIAWGTWPVSGGVQGWSPSPLPAPIGRPLIKNTALFQTSGQVRYTQEQATPPLTLEGAIVLSSRALGRFRLRAPGDDAADRTVAYRRLREHLTERFPGFVDLVTAAHFPAMGINQDAWALDQPILAEEEVRYAGQAIALVLAFTPLEAQRIARYVGASCVAWSGIGWPGPFDAPVLGIERAMEIGSVFPDAPEFAPYLNHVWRVERIGSVFGWEGTRDPLDRSPLQRRERVDGEPCLVVEGSQATGGQAHFYMETQAAIAEPLDLDRMRVVASTQSPAMVHSSVAMALGMQANHVDISVPLVGGGFGGKSVQSRYVATAAAVAAAATQLPVRVALPRDVDTAMIGKRHAVLGQYRIAVDSGQADPANRGVIRGLDLAYWMDGGAYYDASFTVATNLVLRADNYRVANWRATVDVCRTNTAPSTAFRAFGDVQGKNVGEAAIDDAAFALGMTPEEIREKNLYRRGDSTPSGQPLTYCYMPQVWDYLKKQSRYAERRAEVEAFNAGNRWRKRGIAMIPVKYGSGYNYRSLAQATALVSVSTRDGTVTVQMGGVEMGQGLLTYSQQAAAATLNVPVSSVFVTTSSTAVLPDPTDTGASIGTPYYAEAVKRTCERLRSRLIDFGLRLRDDRGEEWCRTAGIDFWNHEQGWAADAGGDGTTRTIWHNLVGQARAERERLVETFTVKVGGGDEPVQAAFKPAADQRPIPGIPLAKDADIGGEVDAFPAFTYSAACAVCEVDILTGEVKILSADIVYDVGFSVNPALDIGQVEGGFVQGIGYLLSEELVFQPDGAETGRLNTTNTWRYKPPAAQSIPLEMNVWLFPRDDESVRDVPVDENQILSAKEVGEPPLVLANSVFFAVKQAVRASRVERGLDGIFRLDAPATPQEVRRACEVSLDDLGA